MFRSILLRRIIFTNIIAFNLIHATSTKDLYDQPLLLNEENIDLMTNAILTQDNYSKKCDDLREIKEKSYLIENLNINGSNGRKLTLDDVDAFKTSEFGKKIAHIRNNNIMDDLQNPDHDYIKIFSLSYNELQLCIGTVEYYREETKSLLKQSIKLASQLPVSDNINKLIVVLEDSSNLINVNDICFDKLFSAINNCRDSCDTSNEEISIKIITAQRYVTKAQNYENRLLMGRNALE